MNRFKIVSAIIIALCLITFSYFFKPIVIKPVEKISQNEDNWNVFMEILNGWKIEYPIEATSVVVTDDLSPDVIENVVFGKKNSGFWFFNVMISRSNLLKIEDFVEKSPSNIKFKKYETIDGIKSAIFEDPLRNDLKYAFLLNKNRLFVIHSNSFVDHERLWKSFHFFKPPILE